MPPNRRIASGRALLAARVAGQGGPVVFLHANVCDSRMWQAQMDAVSAGHLAVAYDRRGFGGTRTEREDHLPVADLMAVMDAVTDGRPAVLVGCSQGGRIAIDAAIRHPSRLSGLVLIAPGVGGAPEPAHGPEVSRVLARLKAAEDAGDLRAVNAAKARLWLDGPLAPKGRVGGEARRLFLAMNGIVLRSPPVGASLDTVSAYARLGEVRAPMLVLWGDLDLPHIQDRSSYVAEAVPDGAALQLSGTAHLPSLDQPAAVTGPLLSFLARVGSRPWCAGID